MAKYAIFCPAPYHRLNFRPADGLEEDVDQVVILDVTESELLIIRSNYGGAICGRAFDLGFWTGESQLKPSEDSAHEQVILDDDEDKAPRLADDQMIMQFLSPLRSLIAKFHEAGRRGAQISRRYDQGVKAERDARVQDLMRRMTRPRSHT